MIAMSKKTFMAAIIITALLVSTLAGAMIVGVAKANFVSITPDESPPTISVSSPLNQTYSKSGVYLSFNVTESSNWLARQQNLYGIGFNGHYQTSIVKVSYFIDNNTVSVFENSGVFMNSSAVVRPYIEFSLILNDLSEGVHTLEIFASGRGYFLDKGEFSRPNLGYIARTISTTNFAVDTVPPSITVLSIDNRTYKQNEIQINCHINETTSGISYSLDNQANTTILGNTTLTGFTEGSHSLVIYANDTAGNFGKSGTVFFTIDTSTPSPSPLPSPSPTPSPTQQPTLKPSPTPNNTQENLTPIVIIIGIVVVIVAVAVGTLFYFRRTKKQK